MVEKKLFENFSYFGYLKKYLLKEYFINKGRETLGFDGRYGWGFIFKAIVSRAVLGPIQPPIQWVPVALCPWE
jgi:hypothetical protein